MFAPDTYIIRLAQVVSVDDNYGCDRIKVRLPYEDRTNTTTDSLPWCFPLLPKMLHIMPKVGEMVLVLLQQQEAAMGMRFFIGPIITQPYTMYKESSNNAKNLLNAKNPIVSLPSPSMNKANKGTLPNRDDVYVEGRYNSDIVLKENESQLRTGYKYHSKDSGENALVFNDSDFAYIQTKYKKYKSKSDEFNSIINIVADKINLLSSKASKGKFDLYDRQELISDSTVKEIVQEAHPMVYGDTLIEYLNLLVDFVKTHTHDMPNESPVQPNNPPHNLFTFPINSIVSDNIKIW